MIKLNDLSAYALSVIERMKEKHEVKTNSKAVIKALEELENLYIWNDYQNKGHQEDTRKKQED